MSSRMDCCGCPCAAPCSRPRGGSAPLPSRGRAPRGGRKGPRLAVVAHHSTVGRKEHTTTHTLDIAMGSLSSPHRELYLGKGDLACTHKSGGPTHPSLRFCTADFVSSAHSLSGTRGAVLVARWGELNRLHTADFHDGRQIRIATEAPGSRDGQAGGHAGGGAGCPQAPPTACVSVQLEDDYGSLRWSPRSTLSSAARSRSTWRQRRRSICPRCVRARLA